QTSSIIIHKISAKVQIFITNSLGATIVNQTTSESSIYLPMGNQPRGIYLVKIITSQGDISTQKIMVY
ncbi:MAG: T9SS type A sorting domain-containing protein, partial [Bacteroidetes bacterium]|nr:T9SS type A sorting domain-containing protein [Bacteroidota bacterium]